MATVGVQRSLSPFFSLRRPPYISPQGLRISNISLPGPRVAYRSGRKPTADGKFRAASRSKGNDMREEKEGIGKENGVVESMDDDSYPDHLSLEYDSVWDTKPSWCQPWTIASTGILAIAGSWMVLHSAIATTSVSALVFAWWYIFLYSYPKAYTEMVGRRKERVTNGLEDTHGSEKKS